MFCLSRQSDSRLFTHYDKDECIIGTWVVDDFRKAVEMSYVVLDTFEFWEYKVMCFDKDSNAGGRSAEYVKMFLKL